MKKDEILLFFQQMSRSTGRYNGILYGIQQHPEVLNRLEEMNFKDATDLVLFLES